MAWTLSARGDGFKPSAGTINRYLSALHAVLAWGAKPSRGYVPTMPEFQWQDEDEGRIRYLTAEEETRLMLLPAGDCQILDTWRVTGLRGTGSNDFTVSDVTLQVSRTALQHACGSDSPGPATPRIWKPTR